MQDVELEIEGMTCAHCVNAVERRLHDTPGVQVQAVEIGHARFRLDEKRTSLAEVIDAIADEGYTVA